MQRGGSCGIAAPAEGLAACSFGTIGCSYLALLPDQLELVETQQPKAGSRNTRALPLLALLASQSVAQGHRSAGPFG